MYLLYLDESGTTNGKHFVLAGPAVFERQTFFLANSLNQLQDEFFPGASTPIEFHASLIRAGKEPPWDSLDKTTRWEILDRVYGIIAQAKLNIFAIVVDKDHEADYYNRAYAEIVKRFDRHLVRLHQAGDTQRGLVIIAESQYRKHLQVFADDISSGGSAWGDLHNMSDVTFFTPARRTRMLQVADFCANAVFGRYDTKQARHYDTIKPKFLTAEDGIVHGLRHICANPNTCACTGCMTHRILSSRS